MKYLHSAWLCAAYLLVLCMVYGVHARYFPVDVVFYSALLNAGLALLLCTPLLFWGRSARSLGGLEKLQLTAIWALLGYTLAISVPTVLDRSLSFYLLEKLVQRGGGIEQTALDRVVTDEYMREYRVVDARLTEQLESGTIEIRQGCVQLTAKGRRIAAISSAFRAAFLPRQRQLMGEYSDQLTTPLEAGVQIRAYSCPPKRAD